MRNFRILFFTLLMSFMAFGLSAQADSSRTSPLNQGDFIVGVSAANAPLSDLQLSASVGYAFSDRLVLGLSDLSSVEDSWSGGVFARYYLDSPFYAQASFNHASDDDTTFGTSLGVTGFLADWVFVEPNVGVRFGDNTELDLGLSFGLRF